MVRGLLNSVLTSAREVPWRPFQLLETSWNHKKEKCYITRIYIPLCAELHYIWHYCKSHRLNQQRQLLAVGWGMLSILYFITYSFYSCCCLIPRLHDTTGCQTRLYNWLTAGLTTGCIHDTAGCQTGCQTGLTTGLTIGCIVYTNIQLVVKGVVSCKRGFRICMHVW